MSNPDPRKIWERLAISSGAGGRGSDGSGAWRFAARVNDPLTQPRVTLTMYFERGTPLP